MKPLAYVPNTCKGLEQLTCVFGMPMKKRGCLSTPKPCTFFVQLRDLAHAYVCENHETLFP
jgi:hypothetical protein